MPNQTTLDQLAQTLRNKVAPNGKLTIDISVITEGGYKWAYETMNKKGFEVDIEDKDKDISYDDASKTLKVTGSGDLFGGSLPLTFQLVGDSVAESACSISGTYATYSLGDLAQFIVAPDLDPSSLPGVSLDNVALSVSADSGDTPNGEMSISVGDDKISSPYDLVPALKIQLDQLGFEFKNTMLNSGVTTQSLDITSEIEIGGITVDIKIELPVAYFSQKNIWKISVTSDQNDGLSIKNLTGLLGGANVFAQFPSGLTGIGGFTLKEFDVSFNPVEKSVSTILIDIGCNDWTITDGFLIKKVGFTLTINSPFESNRTVDAYIYGDFAIGKGDTEVDLQTSMTIPSGEADWFISISGELKKNGFDSVFESLPGNSSQQTPTFPSGLQLESISLNHLYISFNPKSKTLSSISFDVTTELEFPVIPKFIAIENPYVAMDIESPLDSANRELTGIVGGNIVFENGLTLVVSANKPKADKGWIYKAGMIQGQSINILDLLKKFYAAISGEPLPGWVQNDKNKLNISNVAVVVTTPPTGGEGSTKYDVSGKVEWELHFNDNFSFPKTTADVSITHTSGEKAETSGSIAISTQLLGLDFKVGYKFGTNSKDVYLEWLGMIGEYKSTDGVDTISLSFEDKSLGLIISTLMSSIEPGFGGLSAPWSLLNDINLHGMEFTYTLSGPDKGTMEVKYTEKIDLKFIEIDNFKLVKKEGDSRGVYIQFEGKFLGIPIEAGSDNEDAKQLAEGAPVNDMPSPSGLGSQFFDLQYLGLGQHVALYPTKDLTTMKEASDALSNVFQKPKKPAKPSDPPIIPIPPKPSTEPKESILIFNENSNWLIGAQFTIAKVLDMSIIFNDPNLYGLYIGVSDGKDGRQKSSFLPGLEFQILYKKVNDSIGVYQMELQLPEELRNLEFGAVSITLPVIGIDIYTNGNFKLDFGFPASITNFSRSFTVQAFPFTGSGGFYFAYLSGATSDQVPKTTKGSFNPVIAFGLGLSLGVGKTVNKGILSAGLTVTVVGIIEGVIAKFNSNPVPSNPGLKYPGDGEHYYWLQGTFGIVGHLYGEVNFAIISARVDVLVYAYIRITIESYHAIPVYLEAGVRVKLTVKINLGLFKIKIHLSFHATVSASFHIGHDHLQDAPWYDAPALERNIRLLAAFGDFTEVKWQPLKAADKKKVELCFVPHLSLNNEKGSQEAVYAASLFIDSPSSANSGQTSLNNLVYGVTAWTINAFLNSNKSDTTLADLLSQEISIDQLEVMLCYFNTRENNMAPFNYDNNDENNLNDVVHFLREFFDISISDTKNAGLGENDTLSAAAFPMIPSLELQTNYNNQKNSIDFSIYNKTGSGNYLADVSELLAKLSITTENETVAEYYQPDSCAGITDPTYVKNTDQSFATFLFTDFIAMIAKNSIQNAIDYIGTELKDKDSTEKGSIKKSIQTVLDGINNSGTVQNIAGATSRYLLHGMRLPVPPSITNEAKPLFEISGQQVTVPSTLKKGETYQLTILPGKATWITFNGGSSNPSETLSDNEIQRVLDTKGVELKPSIVEGYPKPLATYKDVAQTFTFKSNTLWQYPGDYFDSDANEPNIWMLPQAMLQEIQKNQGKDFDFALKTLKKKSDSPAVKGTIDKAKWGTIVQVDLQKIYGDADTEGESNNTFDVIGADDTGIVYLERLLLAINGGEENIEQIQFLYEPDKLDDDKGGLVSAANGNIISALVQANLSTETNPTDVNLREMLMAEDSTPSNVLNDFDDFVTLLWQCSIVRSGGYYLYYETKDDNKTLPKNLFSNGSKGSIQILITYKNFSDKNYINSVVIGDLIDTSDTSVYAESADIMTRMATLKPGTIGFQLERNQPEEYIPPTSKNPVPSLEDDANYLQSQFNLLGYALDGIEISQNLMPIGAAEDLNEDQVQEIRGQAPEESGDDDWIYKTLVGYDKLLAENSGTTSKNPYQGIGTDAKIDFNWQDMFGNVIATPINSTPLSVPYQFTDDLIALSQWPAITSYYQFDIEKASSKPQLLLKLIIDSNRYTPSSATPTDKEKAAIVNRAQADLLTYQKLGYQLNDAGLIKIFYQSSINGTSDNPQGDEIDVDVSNIQAFVSSIQTFLNEVIKYYSGQSQDKPTFLVPHQESTYIDPANVAAYQDIIELTVSWTIERTKYVDPAFADDNDHAYGVEKAITEIKAYTDSGNTTSGTEKLADDVTENKSNKKIASLQTFATLFETTFEDKPTSGIMLKVAVGTTKTDVSGNKNEKIWMVRFDSEGKSGLNYTFDTGHQFFAPVPLANALKTLTNVPIYEYSTGKAFPPADPQKKNFSGIDLDTWGRQFLEAVDNVLAPEYAVPTFLIDNGESLKKLLDAKKKVAEAIFGNIDYIIEPEDRGGDLVNLNNAQEKLYQQVLIKLSNAYYYNCVVQTSMNISSSYEGSNQDPPPIDKPIVPRLYGDMIGKQPQSSAGNSANISKEYSLSTAKVPIGHGVSWLNYLFTAKESADQRSFSFDDMFFNVNHIEHEISNVDGLKDDDYKASSWLTFVRPLRESIGATGSVDIPIPLRGYPTPPSITNQSPDYNQGNSNEQTTIEEARKWGYKYEYTQISAVQDTIKTQVEFNIPEKQQLEAFALAQTIDLPTALAQFSAVYPNIKNDLSNYLSKVNPHTEEKEPGTFTNAKCALEAFIYLAENVATGWSGWRQINPRGGNKMDAFLAAPLESPKLAYSFTEYKPADVDEFRLQVGPDSNNPIELMPLVNLVTSDKVIKGSLVKGTTDEYHYQNANGDGYLTFKEGKAIVDREVELSNLDILNFQNAWAGIYVTRNEELLPKNKDQLAIANKPLDIEWQETNEKFVYKTPLVKFYNKLLPQLVCDEQILINKIKEYDKPQKLEVYMQDLLMALISNIETQTLQLKVEVEYDYSINGEGKSFPITLPLLLATPFQLDKEGDIQTSENCSESESFACKLTVAIENWFTSNKPSTQDGLFKFKIQVFPSTGSNLPMLKLNNVEIALDQIDPNSFNS